MTNNQTLTMKSNQSLTSQIRSQDMSEHAEEATTFLKSLANSKRMMILCMLSEEEMPVHAINERLNIAQSALSQHLAALRKAGLVATRRDSQTIYYRLKGDKTVRIILLLQEMFCPI